MKLIHIVTLVVFVFALFFNGFNLTAGAITCAAWGWWLSLILGGLIFVIYSIIPLAGGVAGAAAGIQSNSLPGAIGGLLGGAALGGLIMIIPAAIAFAIIALGMLGYSSLETAATHNFEVKGELVKCCVLLGLSVLLSFLGSSSSSKKS